jgi:phasin family protein
MATARSQTTKAAKEFEAVAAAYDKTANGAGEAMKDNVQRAMGAAAEFTAFGKGTLDAWVASTVATQKGVEAISARAVAYSKTALENHVAATKALLASKSVQEVVEKQTEYARSAFDEYIAELNKISDLMASFAKDALRPLNERVSAVSTIMQNGRHR